jgi:hypothetical protein
MPHRSAFLRETWNHFEKSGKPPQIAPKNLRIYAGRKKTKDS